MPLKPRLEAFLKEMEQRKDTKRKTIENVMAEYERTHKSAYRDGEFGTLKLLNNESIGRDGEVLGLLILIVGLAEHIDHLYAKLEQVGSMSKELDTAKQTIAEREELFNKIEQTYRNMQAKEAKQREETEEIWRRQKERGMLA